MEVEYDILLYKNKGNIQNYNNYRGVKLLGYTMNAWVRVVKTRVRRRVSIFEHQSVFILG